MEIFETIKRRCSVREYDDREIPEDELKKIIDAARVAPTARGQEPWEFIVITDKHILRKLSDFAENGKFIGSAAAGIVVVCKDTKYYIEDGSAATENMLLAATALGIGSCWIAGDKKDYTGQVLCTLGVPQGYKLVSMISLGYPQGEIKPHLKRDLEEVIHYNQF